MIIKGWIVSIVCTVYPSIHHSPFITLLTLMKRKIYFISGLGADRSVFDQLDLSFCEPVFLDWITPIRKESLEAYALRLAKNITEPDATIVGLSMGGMMAVTIVTHHPQMKAIIISSNRTAAEFPSYTKFFATYLPLYQLATPWILRCIFPLSCWFLGAATPEEKQHLARVIRQTDIRFMKWCIGAIARRKKADTPQNIIHIHGTADRLLPYSLVQPDYTIKGGGHLMVRNKAAEISGLLKKICI